MLAPLDLVQQLRGRLTELAAGLSWSGQGSMLSLLIELPPDGFRSFPQTGLDQFCFLSPAGQERRYGVGNAGSWRFSGAERMQRLHATARRLSAGWRYHDPDDTGMHPFALLGFAHTPTDPMSAEWRDVPNTLLWVPELAVHSAPGQAALVFSSALPADPDAVLQRWQHLIEELIPAISDNMPPPLPETGLAKLEAIPDEAAWRRIVESAVDAIAHRSLHKVVPGRRIRIDGERIFDPSRLRSALAYLFPSCQIMSLRIGATEFTAATPERLLTLRNRQLQVDAIAGTAPRAATRERDRELAEALYRSPKIHTEHELVVRQLSDTLAPLALSLEAPETPQLLQLSNVQHLWTPISGRVDHAQDLITLAATLHPSPAVNGYPGEAASRWLARHEPFRRGWYAGGMGWMTPDLEGELWAPLRCALLDGSSALLYAGAGVVEGSEPEAEYRETEYKFDGMLSALRYA